MLRYLVMLLIAVSNAAVAVQDNAPTQSERRMLPPYCGVKFDDNRTSAAWVKWKSIFGEDYEHTHHYCTALAYIARARTKLGTKEAAYWAGVAIGDINYSLRGAKARGNKWKLMPEAYLMRGRAYEIQGNKVQAAQDYLTAVQMKQDYIPGYIELSDLYTSMGDNESAKSYLEEGLKIKPNSKGLNRRYKKITGAKYEEDQIYK